MSWSNRTDDPLPEQHPDKPRRWRVSDLAKSVVRTWVPIAVGAVVAWAGTRWGIVVPDDVAGEAVIWIAGAVMAAYYYAARWLEGRTGSRWHARLARWLGRWLLGGVISAPTYPQGQRG